MCFWCCVQLMAWRCFHWWQSSRALGAQMSQDTVDVSIDVSTWCAQDARMLTSLSLSLSLSLAPVPLSPCLPLYLCLSLSISVYICLYLSISVYLSTYLSIYLAIYPSIHLCYPSMRLCIYPSLHQSINLLTFQSICLSIYLNQQYQSINIS